MDSSALWSRNGFCGASAISVTFCFARRRRMSRQAAHEAIAASVRMMHAAAMPALTPVERPAGESIGSGDDVMVVVGDVEASVGVADT